MNLDGKWRAKYHDHVLIVKGTNYEFYLSGTGPARLGVTMSMAGFDKWLHEFYILDETEEVKRLLDEYES